MDKPFTTEELQNAIKQQLQSNPNSSPGKDDLTLPFLKAILPQTEEQVVTTFNNLTTATDLPQQMKPINKDSSSTGASTIIYKDFNNSSPSKPPTSPTPYSSSISRRHLKESIINTCISNSQASTFLKALSTS
ncbi:unnamed protein product [Ambrosiozyma monospora]|uniref:Unnamed protein product n=1 Tax=Ambrosiozyma monospora TaxID=43982 RepID=A0ACB5T3L4_AMBMO|nr:unnamed protein product [Ambrosiozyma monospora]